MPIIKSRTKHFRRAGIEFSREGHEVDLDKLSKARREAIEAEPQLVIEKPKDADKAAAKAAAANAAAEKAAAEKAAAEAAAAKGTKG